MGKVVVFGGGTFNPVACHLALAVPAFGETAKRLVRLFKDNGTLDTQLVLTKMADTDSKLIYNDDVENFLCDSILPDEDVKAIVMNAAICDFTMENPSTETRLSSAKDYQTTLKGVTSKIVAKIKQRRPDIIVCGFKTTHGASKVEQTSKAFASMAANNLDLVLANDLKSRNNILITKDLTIQEGRREWLMQQIVDNIVIYTNMREWGLDK
ncbi:hypothetical protein ISREJYDI_CDS0079 [Pseudomonas phage UNO-G1W1]|uniref:DNA/pantothenate metabolism flavoprotein C-terminal domain-containing protein n=1 Tax=Pseudomonas phage UNO-G1W1 TaxID=3136609 RepID=A0AAX4MVQ9_9CAUD